MSSSSSFEKVGECLYRNPSSQQYYALLKIRGKQIKRSFKTNNLAEVRRKLKDFRRDQDRIDPTAGRMTVAALCERQLEIIANGSEKTVTRQTLILKRVRARWGETDAARVKSSEVKSWLGTWEKNIPTYNLHPQGIRELFKPAEFKAIVHSIHCQKLDVTQP